MAIPPETSLSSLLRADSEQPLPDTDKGVVDLLNSYGASFKKGKTFAPERLNLLAGLMWVHAHRDDLHVVWSTASAAQHRLLPPHQIPLPVFLHLLLREFDWCDGCRPTAVVSQISPGPEPSVFRCLVAYSSPQLSRTWPFELVSLMILSQSCSLRLRTAL
jgi:hypothetical protein